MALIFGGLVRLLPVLVMPALCNRYVRKTPLTQKHAAADPADPVDFVYCWAGESRAGCSKSKNPGDPKNVSGSLAATHDGGCDLGEMRFSLRSVRKFAPWVRNVFILVDGPAGGGPAPIPSFIQESNAGPIKMVNRCSLFDRPEDCPTMNAFACQSVVHRIPGLANKVLFFEDDQVLANPLQISDIFDKQGRARVFDHNDGKLSLVYGEPAHLNGPDLPPAHVPMRLGEQPHHTPIPIRRDALVELEEEYKEFFAFVRSHTRRFNCCDANKVSGPSVTEDLNPVWKAWMVKSGKGVLDTSRGDVFCPAQNGYSLDCFRGHFLNPHEIFANFNSASPGRQWEGVQAILEKKLAEPAPHEVPTLPRGLLPTNWHKIAGVVTLVFVTLLLLLLAFFVKSRTGASS